jgi:raffinose/stachyose/melibiose transport system permease protein
VKDVLGDKRAIAILLGPALVMYSLIMLGPTVWSFVYSVFDGNLIHGFTFVGIGNFQRMFADEQVASAIRITLAYAVIISTLQIIVGYGLALFYMFVLKKSSNIMRTLIFFPVVLPSVAVGLLFSRIFGVNPTFGPVVSFLQALGVQPFDFFGGGTTAFWVIIIMDLWRSMGFYGILLYSGLVDIPTEVIEASKVDGAVGWGMIRHVIVPLSMPILATTIIFSLNASLKVFDSIVALTNGGPGTATTPLNLFMFWTSFLYNDFGYGASMAVLITAMSLVVTVLIFRSSRRDITVSEG